MADSPEPFVVRHYIGDEYPTIKGNGFDGLVVGTDRLEAEVFVNWVNAQLNGIPSQAVLRYGTKQYMRGVEDTKAQYVTNAQKQSSLGNLSQGDGVVVSPTTDVHKGIAVPAADAREEDSVVVDLGLNSLEHHLQAATSTSPHDGSPVVTANGTRVDLPNLPKPFRVEQPQNSEPYGLFTAKQMIEYRLMQSATPSAGDARDWARVQSFAKKIMSLMDSKECALSSVSGFAHDAGERASWIERIARAALAQPTPVQQDVPERSE